MKKLTLEERAERSWSSYGYRHRCEKPYPELCAYRIGYFAGYRAGRKDENKRLMVYIIARELGIGSKKKRIERRKNEIE